MTGYYFIINKKNHLYQRDLHNVRLMSPTSSNEELEYILYQTYLKQWFDNTLEYHSHIDVDRKIIILNTSSERPDFDTACEMIKYLHNQDDK